MTCSLLFDLIICPSVLVQIHMDIFVDVFLFRCPWVWACEILLGQAAQSIYGYLKFFNLMICILIWFWMATLLSDKFLRLLILDMIVILLDQNLFILHILRLQYEGTSALDFIVSVHQSRGTFIKLWFLSTYLWIFIITINLRCAFWFAIIKLMLAKQYLTRFGAWFFEILHELLQLALIFDLKMNVRIKNMLECDVYLAEKRLLCNGAMLIESWFQIESFCIPLFIVVNNNIYLLANTLLLVHQLFRLLL